MFANSRSVISSQTAVHTRLHETVLRHMASPYRRQPSAAGERAFASIVDRLARAPFVLDAGCGTGASTLALARQFPDCIVLGVDRSAARLAIGKHASAAPPAPKNVILLRCELVDFWQLAAAAGLRCVRQYLLYPNPWPKPAQLQRRWHAHPVFAAMLKLGGTIELRTNWRIYADEFAEALRLADAEPRLDSFVPEQPLTPFERKYLASAHTLWRCRADATPQSRNDLVDGQFDRRLAGYG